MKTEARYTMITGASMGLGREFAIEYARRGHNLILVALPGRNLELFGRELEIRCAVKVTSYETDLTDRGELGQLIECILTGYHVDRLINNAGVGGTRRFTNASQDYLDRIWHASPS